MSGNGPVSEDVANKIFDVLVTHLNSYPPKGEDDADDPHRMEFVHYATEGTWTEFRFGGLLGFGGKAWNVHGRWYVNCYREDSSSKREALIAKTNEALDELWEATYGEPPQKW